MIVLAVMSDKPRLVFDYFKQLLKNNQIFITSSFKLKEIGIGDYVGWQLQDKRGRFLLYGGLCVHNTPEGGSVGIVTSAGPHPRLSKCGYEDEIWCMVECTHGGSIYIDHYCLEVLSESR